MILPAGLKAGDVLPDCEMKMKIAFINISASYTEGVCEGEETITTEAGTFNCKKIKFRCKSSAMGIKSDMIVESWYAPGIGLVKQYLYNKGKLNTTQEIVELNR
jgi:translation initiation factor IF-2